MMANGDGFQTVPDLTIQTGYRLNQTVAKRKTVLITVKTIVETHFMVGMIQDAK